jgi:transposase
MCIKTERALYMATELTTELTDELTDELTAEFTIDRPTIGRPKTVDEAYVQRLEALVRQSPKGLGYAFDRWTAYWLREHLLGELGIAVTERHINRLLRQMGLSKRQRLQVSRGKLTHHEPIAIVDLFPKLN